MGIFELLKGFITILFILTTFTGYSQRQFFYGVVKDSTTHEEMIGAHIRNITSDKLAIADEYGKFRLTAQKGDSIVVSSIGYQTLLWIAKGTWFSQERITFKLPVDTVYLAEVVVNKLPEYARFKQLIYNSDPEDTSFWYHGMPRTEMKEHNAMEKKEYLNPMYMLTHPLSAMHHAFSKKEKEKRKIQELSRQQGMNKMANQKFSRDWVGEMTELEGHRLTNFIEYCKFSSDFINKTPLYIIHEKMMVLLEDFLEGEKDKDKG